MSALQRFDRSAHRWLDELLFDPTQTIESLAVRESKSERSIRIVGVIMALRQNVCAALRSLPDMGVGQIALTVNKETVWKTRCHV